MSHKQSAIKALCDFDAEYIGGRSFLVGIDEAGRGALAGPVCAGAVAIRASSYENEKFLEELVKLDDSKKMTEKTRAEIFKKLVEFKRLGFLDFEAAYGSVEEIETHNILVATQMAMARATDVLNARQNLCLCRAGGVSTLLGEHSADFSRAVVIIDGKPMKKFPYAHSAVVKGDASSLAVAAASVVAKVSRDLLMQELSMKYRFYGFEIHKGYGTAAHMQSLLLYGASEIHRPSFLKKLRADPIEDVQSTFDFS